ncbi:MAG: peptidase domain-containing ABC transporter [Bacteroidales bacterium]|nr:peptidase domain-containing ABC transporter [Bacteroidales bacterium]
MSFPHYKQLDAMDCGPTCLRMVAKHHGKSYSLENLRQKSKITREGVSLLGISEAAEAIGMRTMGVKITFEQLEKEAPLPAIVHWKQNHFVVVYKIVSSPRRKGQERSYKIYIADPAAGLLVYTKEEFIQNWISTKSEKENKGIALLLEPTPDFYSQKDEKTDKKNLKFLFKYLKPHKKFIVQLFIGLLAGSLLQLLFPFLTQSIVDFGISNQNLNFVQLVLIAQLVLFASKTSVEFIRNWILLHISTRINISLISDFLIKLMKLPIRFFDTKMIGDILQRISDHNRIENFLTSTTLEVLFSVFNLIIFGAILAIYSLKILLIFLVGSIIYSLWVLVFMKKRRDLDFKRFSQMSDNQSNLIQLITGMQEIKLNNCERQKRWDWERIQARIFKINVKSLSLNQFQQGGSSFINETKNILISFVAATSVIKGDMTLGMMLAVQYIIGQLNTPIAQMINFTRSAQDAKISLERLGEIHEKEDEENINDDKINILPENKTLEISDLSFEYEGAGTDLVLKNINLVIPEKKITAIVGTSGSGKTTLIKLLLGFYPPKKGEITVGKTRLENYSQKMWREKCGVVMQDGFIFSDTIANNISVSDEITNLEKLQNSVRIANIQPYIDSLPLSFNTKIGMEGTGLSQGQKQRILIARAVYKSPDFIFFDEATNSLDANNEKIIMENLNKFFEGRTVVVVAHRLSTVKNADQIVVLEKGEIVEIGNHAELTEKKGAYYELVKNQLELGN